MKDKHTFAVLFVLKLLAAGFFISAIASFVAAIMYNVNNEDVENSFIYLFVNLGVTLFFRMVMAVFFFAFAVFVEDWLKTE
jgi:hypothetical protein